MGNKVQRYITFWQRFSLTILLITLHLLGTSDVTCYEGQAAELAQAQPQQDAATRLQILNAIQAAHDHYHERRYAEAIKAYQTLLKTELRQSQADSLRLMLGQSYEKLGEDAEARLAYKQIIDENPDGVYATQAASQLGNLYRQRYQFDAALLQFKQIIKQHPDTQAAAISAYLIGSYQYVDGKYDEAVVSFKNFLDNFPTSPYRSSAISSLIRLYTQSKRYAEAEKLLTERIQQNPTDITLLEELATLYQQQGKYDEALELYRGTLEQNPGNTSLRRKLGSLYAELGKIELAKAEWQKLVANDASQNQQLGAIYLAHKLYPEAIQAYQQAIQMNPQYGYLYTQLAAVYKIQGNIDEALSTYLDALLRIGPIGSQRETVWNAMLEIYEGENQKPLQEKLLVQLQEAQRATPQNLNVTLTLGELSFYAGQFEKALETFAKLHRRYPTAIDATLERYARVLERKQNPAAVGFYKTLVQVTGTASQRTNAQYKLARLYQKIEAWDEAATLLKELNSGSAASTTTQLLLARIQLHGHRDPTAAQITLQRMNLQGVITTQSMEVQVLLGECHLLLKAYTRAREVLAPIADTPNRFQAAARKLIGDTYFFAADFEKAHKAYKQVIGISKSDRLTNDALERIILIQDHPDYFKMPLTDYATALQHYLSGDTEAAIAQCQNTISLQPQALIVDDMWLLLGTIYQNQRADADAIRAYQQIIEMESHLAVDALTQIAKIYQKQNDFTNALDTYTLLVTKYPDNSIIPYARQQLDEIKKLIQ